LLLLVVAAAEVQTLMLMEVVVQALEVYFQITQMFLHH